MVMTYKEQLLHPNWQRKRLEIMRRDEFRCRRCLDAESTLHVHHKQYAKGRLAWEYPDDELITLCESCHEEMHVINVRLRNVIAKLRVGAPRAWATQLRCWLGGRPN
jgi:5-methylcytosine-specific restriction endonuclease McrA